MCCHDTGENISKKKHSTFEQASNYTLKLWVRNGIYEAKLDK